MEVELHLQKRRNWVPAIAVILLWALIIGAVVWRLNHPQPKAPLQELTQEERASQALTLAGVAAAGNPGTAVYTPMLFALASNIKEGEGTNVVSTVE